MRKIEFIDDCIKLQKVALVLGYAPTLYQIEFIWLDISKDDYAEWLDVNSYLIAVDKFIGSDWLNDKLIERLERLS